ncbi:hypothetical protein D8Y22_20830 [Salinadaptatus halalkaliphilus]|uniref:Uncharacterized protein n=1 Tax=Salinadaptatus halalkaliphilus TaxID=2419781 RepID=A0A4S3TG90_9EURY|nr:hypothetical protein [Salinadaptatus halalkaliphilus]THE62901.1 hypothetical protein D8Y22_20830 [Salinadaptatus halalkaliphilus]
MNVPTDRLLIMLIVATGFAVVVGGWAGGLVHTEATGWEEIGLRVGIAALLFVVLLGVWQVFKGVDEERS